MMTLKESIISAAQSAGFTVLDSFSKYDIAQCKSEPLAFICDESCELSEEWIGIGGISYREAKRRIKITAFSKSPDTAAELTDSVFKLSVGVETDEELYGVKITVSEPKRSAAHNRLYCEAHFEARETTKTEDGEGS